MEIQGSSTPTGSVNTQQPLAAGQAPAAQTPPAQGQEPPAQTKPEGQNAPQGDDLGFTEKQQAYIKSLREESASYRTKAKSLDERLGKFEQGFKNIFGEPEKPATLEERMEQLEAQRHQDNETAMEMENRSNLIDMAYQHGIAKEDFDYFDYSIHKAFESMSPEEQEQGMSDEMIAQVVAQVNSKSNVKQTKTSVGGNAPQGKTGSPGDIDVDSFAKMNMGEKSVLYRKNPDLYNKLVAEAKAAGKFI